MFSPPNLEKELCEQGKWDIKSTRQTNITVLLSKEVKKGEDRTK